MPVLFPFKYKLHKLSSCFPRKALARAWSSHIRFSVRIPILSASTVLRFKHFGGFMGLQGKNFKSDSLSLFYTYAFTLWYQFQVKSIKKIIKFCLENSKPPIGFFFFHKKIKYSIKKERKQTKIPVMHFILIPCAFLSLRSYNISLIVLNIFIMCIYFGRLLWIRIMWWEVFR